VKKAIIFDIDGIAIDSPIQKLPTTKLVKVIKHLKNKYLFCAATGSVWSFARPILSPIRIFL